jgi:TolB-like protein/Tfp pilus assembly protein PilF
VFNIIGVGSQNREPEKSIAVLPFQNDSPEVSEETTNFINGLMDELISNLQRIKELRVLGRNSVEQYRNNMSKSNPDIARQLGVTYIVEGSGQKYGNSFSLRVRLINAKGKEALIWTKSYEQEIKGTEDIFAVPSQISQTIAYELKTVISPEEKLLIEKTSTTNIEALYFYQQGNEEYRKYMINNSDKEALLKAELYYRKALNYDSTFARAYTGLAGVYWGKHFIEEYLTQDFMDSVLIYSNIALGYDDHIAEAYLLRGDYHRERIESKQALEEYDKALNINPNFWQAYSSRASLYYLTGDYDKAYEDAILAIKLNRGPELPVSLLTLGLPAMHYGFFNEAKYFLDEVLKLNGDSAFYLYYLGMLEMYQENFGKAIEYSERSYFLDSTQTELLQNLGNFYWVTGQKETALDYYNKYISRSESFKSKLWFEEKTHSIQAVHRLGYCYWITGHKDKAELYFDEQKRICEESIKLNREYGAKAYYDLAGIYALRGEKEKAYENLHLYVKESGENHTYAMIWYLKYDPFFDSIRNEPEFQDILAERKAKYQESHEKLRKWLEDQGII